MTVHLDIVSHGQPVASTGALDATRRVRIAGRGYIEHVAADTNESGWSADIDVTVTERRLVDRRSDHRIRLYHEDDAGNIERLGTVTPETSPEAPDHPGRYGVACSGLESVLQSTVLNEGRLTKLREGFDLVELIYQIARIGDPRFAETVPGLHWDLGYTLAAAWSSPASTQAYSVISDAGTIGVLDPAGVATNVFYLRAGETPWSIIAGLAQQFAIIPTFDRHGLFRAWWPTPKPVPPQFVTRTIAAGDASGFIEAAADGYNTSGAYLYADVGEFGQQSAVGFPQRTSLVSPLHIEPADPLHSGAEPNSLTIDMPDVRTGFDGSWNSGANPYGVILNDVVHDQPATAAQSWARAVDHPDTITVRHAVFDPTIECHQLAFVYLPDIDTYGVHRTVAVRHEWDTGGENPQTVETLRKVAP